MKNQFILKARIVSISDDNVGINSGLLVRPKNCTKQQNKMQALLIILG